MTDRSVAAGRLVSLLAKIRDRLHEALDSHRLESEQANRELPSVKVSRVDIDTAVLYLRDFGLEYDALRLHREFRRCVYGCVGEWLTVIANGESEEYRDCLAEEYGTFPVQVDPNDPMATNRRVMLVGLIAQLSEFVDELFETVNVHLQAARETSPKPKPTSEPVPPDNAVGFLGGEHLANALGIDPSRRDAFFRKLERKRLELGDDNWHEIRKPQPNSPRFLYRVDSPEIQQVAVAYKQPKPA